MLPGVASVRRARRRDDPGRDRDRHEHDHDQSGSDAAVHGLTLRGVELGDQRRDARGRDAAAGLIQTERDGFLDDPSHIERLPDEHPLKRNENLFAFSTGCAALELNQLLSMALAPGGVSDFGGQRHELVRGTCTRDERTCRYGCPFSGQLLGRGDHIDFTATGRHTAAVTSRQELARRRRSMKVRARRAFAALVDRATRS